MHVCFLSCKPISFKGGLRSEELCSEGYAVCSEGKKRDESCFVAVEYSSR